MDLLGIRETTASRPSLISSMWSLQVQPQQETTLITEMQSGSQQSLPQLASMDIDATDSNSALRPSKSLSELSQFFKDSRLLRIHEAPSFVWRKTADTPNNQQPNPISMISRQDSAFVLSRQQKERNICEWLQQLNVAEAPSRPASTSLPPVAPSLQTVQLSQR